MFKMRFGTALALLAVLVSPVRLQCTATCRIGNQPGYVEGQCPIILTSDPFLDKENNIYFEYVIVRVWIKAEDFSSKTLIEILKPHKVALMPTLGKRKRNVGLFLFPPPLNSM